MYHRLELYIINFYSNEFELTWKVVCKYFPTIIHKISIGISRQHHENGVKKTAVQMSLPKKIPFNVCACRFSI